MCVCVFVSVGDWVLSEYRELIPYSSCTNCLIINVSQPGFTLESFGELLKNTDAAGQCKVKFIMVFQHDHRYE